MPSKPLISVIMPAYNAARTIGAAITGVLTQTYPHVELVVVDDGSTDETPAIVRSYGGLIVETRQDNGGTARARNRAIAQASGDFIALCDSDDILLPGHLQTAMSTWVASGGGRRLVASNATLLTTTGIGHGRVIMLPGVPPRNRQRQAILEGNYVPVFTLTPRELFDELGGFSEDLMVEDWDLWLRAVFGGWEVVPQRNPQALYRWTDESKSSRLDEVLAGETELLQRARANLAKALTAKERTYLDRRLASEPPRQLLHKGDLALRRGSRREAHDSYRQAARLLPSNRRVRLKALLTGTGVTTVLLRRIVQRFDSSTGRDPKEAR